jgi:nitroreductase
MDVFEAVDTRKACRWFLDKPVDLNIVRNLIEQAGRAASNGNLQPWNVHALRHKGFRCADITIKMELRK